MKWPGQPVRRHQQALPPRSKERGPVEVFVFAVTGAAFAQPPRSKERGPVEVWAFGAIEGNVLVTSALKGARPC